MINAYIGLLECPNFDFYNGNPSGNIPERISPYLLLSHDIFHRLWELIHQGAANVRQLDWGAVGVIYSKQQLWDFIGSLNSRNITHIIEHIDEIKTFIQSLDSEAKYVLVAYEDV